MDFFGLLAFLGCCRTPGLPPGVGGKEGGRAPELPLGVGGREEGGRAAFPGEGRRGAAESELVRFLFFTFLEREVSLHCQTILSYCWWPPGQSERDI